MIPMFSLASAVGLDSIIRPDSEDTLLHLLLFGYLQANPVSVVESNDEDALNGEIDLTTPRFRSRWTVKVAKRTAKNIFLFDILLRYLYLIFICLIIY